MGSKTFLGEEVDPGDRAIWNGTTWDLLHDGSDAGVVDITGIEPIVVDDTTAGEPIISVNDALETSAALTADRTSRKGVVPSIAVAGDIASNVGNASPNPEAVVPADLIKGVNENIDSIDARVTVNEGDITDIKQDITDINTEIGNINTEIDGIKVDIEAIQNGGTLSALKGEDPIVVTTELVDDTLNPGDTGYGETETTVSIKDATTVQKAQYSCKRLALLLLPALMLQPRLVTLMLTI